MIQTLLLIFYCKYFFKNFQKIIILLFPKLFYIYTMAVE